MFIDLAARGEHMPGDNCRAHAKCYVTSIVGLTLCGIVGLWIIIAFIRRYFYHVAFRESFCCCCISSKQEPQDQQIPVQTNNEKVEFGMYPPIKIPQDQQVPVQTSNEKFSFDSAGLYLPKQMSYTNNNGATGAKRDML